MPDGKRAAGFYRSGRGRLPRTPTEDAPLFLGCFFPRSRSDGTPTDQGATFRAERMSSRRRGGEEARSREGDRGPGRSIACGDREDGRGDSWARGNETVYHIGFDQRVDVLNMVRRIKESKNQRIKESKNQRIKAKKSECRADKSTWTCGTGSSWPARSGSCSKTSLR